MNKVIQYIILSLAIVLAAFLLSEAVIHRNSESDTIWVKGLGKTSFTSDLIVWNGSFSTKSFDLKSAYQKIDADRKVIKDFFRTKGIKDDMIVFNAVKINKEFIYSYDERGRSSQTFDGYRLQQTVEIQSEKVDEIELLSREITAIINQGVEFYSNPPRYYYTKIEDLKLEMIAKATENARSRAEQIALNSKAELGSLKSARMGVFQIIANNSNDNYSWGGAYNTTSKEKTANITMTLEYQIN